jgi:hypothetical protein
VAGVRLRPPGRHPQPSLAWAKTKITGELTRAKAALLP